MDCPYQSPCTRQPEKSVDIVDISIQVSAHILMDVSCRIWIFFDMEQLWDFKALKRTRYTWVGSYMTLNGTSLPKHVCDQNSLIHFHQSSFCDFFSKPVFGTDTILPQCRHFFYYKKIRKCL